MRTAGATMVVVSGLFMLACSGLPGMGGIMLEQELDDASGATAVALLLTLDEETGRLPDATLDDCEAHGSQFVWLSARREEPEEIAAALEGLATCSEHLHPPDRRAVIEARLTHEDSRVVGRAVQAAGPLLAELASGDPIVAGVAALATSHSDSAVRYEAVVALDAHPWHLDEATAAAFLAALSDESPPVKSEALKLIRARTEGLVSAPSFIEQAASLAQSDIDPGVRGRAVLLLVRLGADEASGAARALLDDGHPYARAAAAEALSELGDPAAVHLLVQHLDDPKEAVWTMRPWMATDGSEWVQHHIGSPYERVDDAVLRALVALTADLGEAAYQYRDVNPEWRDLDIVAATRDAQRWYDEHGAEVPQ